MKTLKDRTFKLREGHAIVVHGDGSYSWVAPGHRKGKRSKTKRMTPDECIVFDFAALKAPSHMLAAIDFQRHLMWLGIFQRHLVVANVCQLLAVVAYIRSKWDWYA